MSNFDVEAVLKTLEKPSKLNKCVKCTKCSFLMIKIVSILTAIIVLCVAAYYAYTTYQTLHSTVDAMITPIKAVVNYPVQGLRDCFSHPSLHNCMRGFMPLPTYLVETIANVTLTRDPPRDYVWPGWDSIIRKISSCPNLPIFRAREYGFVANCDCRLNQTKITQLNNCTWDGSLVTGITNCFINPNSQCLLFERHFQNLTNLYKPKNS
jgi:hypothetical protein